MYTRLLCVPMSGLKLTHFGYSLKSHEENTPTDPGKENKTGCDLQDVQLLQAGHGTVIASTEFGVTFKEMGEERNQKKKQIWTYSHLQPSCQKQRVEDVTVCITYDTMYILSYRQI